MKNINKAEYSVTEIGKLKAGAIADFVNLKQENEEMFKIAMIEIVVGIFLDRLDYMMQIRDAAIEFLYATGENGLGLCTRNEAAEIVYRAVSIINEVTRADEAKH